MTSELGFCPQDLILTLLSCYGLAWVVSMGKITLGLREALERHGFDFTVQLMECCGCTGFWMGFGIGWWKATAPAGVLYAIAFGLCVAASNLLMNAVVVFGDRQP